MFKPHKLAGPNETVPALLQQGTEQLVTYVCHICTACQARGYTPKAWRQVKVSHFSNSQNNFWFKTIWLRQYVAALIL